MFGENKTLKERLTGKRKTLDKKITGEEAIKIMNSFDGGEIKRGIDYIDFRPTSPGSIPPYTGEDNVEPSNMAKYIKEEFPYSAGNYKVFYNKKQDINEHRIKLYRNSEGTPEPLRIEFSDR